MFTDLHNSIKATRGISPITGTDDTALVSQIIDRAGYEALTFVILAGTLADADAVVTFLVEDGANASLTDNAAVADGFLIGTEAPTIFYSDDNLVRKISYIGPKRYVRLTLTPANNTGSLPVAVVALLGSARDLGVAKGTGE